MSKCIQCHTDVRGSRIECIGDTWLHDNCVESLRKALSIALFDTSCLKRAHDDQLAMRQQTEAELKQAKQWSAELKLQLLECKSRLREQANAAGGQDECGTT